MLEQTFIVYRLPVFSRNLRNALRKSRKVYFYDNGIRNSLINIFAPISLRNDKGALCENFFMSGRLKKISYENQYCNRYFWHTINSRKLIIIKNTMAGFTPMNLSLARILIAESL